jgi:hypothetical protein
VGAWAKLLPYLSQTSSSAAAPVQMKSRLIIAAVASLFLLVWRVVSIGTSASSAEVPPTIRFVGFTNAVLGPTEPIRAVPNNSHQAALKGWLAGGTNAVVFIISNRQSRTLRLDEVGQMLSRGANPDLAYLLWSTNFRGFFLAPHQEATVQVAFPPNRAPWKLRLYFTRDSREHTILDVPRGILRALGNGKALPHSPLESEWINDFAAPSTLGQRSST